jgi:hypothetical protein
MTFGVREQLLSTWMADNALVSWVTDPKPWLVEGHLIAGLDVPLNIDGNAHNRFHPELTATRAAAVAQARALPVLPNPALAKGSDLDPHTTDQTSRGDERPAENCRRSP